MTNHFMLDGAPLSIDELTDADVYGPDEQTVGQVAHVHQHDDGDLIVVDAGGFLGFGSKRVALNASQVTFVRDEDGIVFGTTTLTKDQVRELPEHHD